MRGIIVSAIVQLTVACVAFTGCAQQAVEPEEPAMTQAEAEAAAREFVVAFDNALNSGDADALAELYTDDGRRYRPGEPPLIGKDAIRAGFLTFFEQYDVNVQDQVENVIRGEDLLIARGSFKGTRTPKAGGDPVQVSGHWIDYKRLQQDGSWKRVESMYVQDPTPPQE